jgi:hypothetical protein
VDALERVQVWGVVGEGTRLDRADDWPLWRVRGREGGQYEPVGTPPYWAMCWHHGKHPRRRWRLVGVRAAVEGGGRWSRAPSGVEGDGTSGDVCQHWRVRGILQAVVATD